MSRRGWLAILLILLLTLAGGLASYFYNETRLDAEQRDKAIAITGGDPENAPLSLVQYGCTSCHVIPNMPNASGYVGPSLVDIGKRVYIGGVLTNTPENLIRWIVNPRAIDPQSAMPATGISEPEARDVAAYLYSIR
jgi:cytochrome c1